MLPIFIIFLSNHCGGLVLSYTYRWEYAFSCLVLHTDGSTRLVFSLHPSDHHLSDLLRIASPSSFPRGWNKNTAVRVVVWPGELAEGRGAAYNYNLSL